MKQGEIMPEILMRKIQWLLFSTSMSPGEIAERLRCAKSTVVRINRKSQIRDYAGSRSTWTLNTSLNIQKPTN